MIALARLGWLALLIGALAVAGCGESRAVKKAREHTERGYALIDQERWEESLAAFQAAVAKAPDYQPARVGLGVLYSLEGRNEEAENVFASVLQRDPNSAAAHREWAMSLARQGKFDEADAKFIRSLELEPNSARALRGRAMVMGARGRDLESLALFEQADAAGGSEANAMAFLHWGSSLTRLERHDEARGKFEAGLRRSPSDPTLLNNLGLNLVRTGRAPESGVKLLERAVQMRPDNAEVLHNLGWAYLVTGRREQATIVLKRAVETTDPKSAAYAVRVAHLQEASGETPAVAEGTPGADTAAPNAAEPTAVAAAPATEPAAK